MKRILYIISGLILLFLMGACRKVINVDLNSASPKYVIEADITNGIGPNLVKITRTKNFSDDNTFPGVSGAVITISDNAGNATILTEVSPGYYNTSGITGVPGRTYFLSIKINNETFNASSIMPAPVNFDTLYVENFTQLKDTTKIANAVFLDPAGVKNYYRHVMYINNKYVKELFVNNDDLNDGNLINMSIFSGGDDKIQKGDSVKIEMQCIDEYVYKYFSTLSQTISQNSAAPTNPVNNIQGALGYFSAHTIQVRKLKVNI